MRANTIYLAGGCFWGMQKFFDQFGGVIRTEVGYANGPDKVPTYQQVCSDSGHAETVRIDYDPDRITLSLAIEKASDKKVGIKSNDKKVGIKSNDNRISGKQKDAIIAYLTDHIQATSSELSSLLGVGQERTRKVLRELVAEEIIVTEGANRNRLYKLKA